MDTDLNSPQGRVIAAFENSDDAQSTVDELELSGIAGGDVQLLMGGRDAGDVETRTQWFSDTHQHMRRFRDVLDNGGSIVAVETPDEDTVVLANRVCHNHGTVFVFHFGPFKVEQMHRHKARS